MGRGGGTSSNKVKGLAKVHLFTLCMGRVGPGRDVLQYQAL
jgi:hypothetical protein